MSLVFERVVAEDEQSPDQPDSDEVNLEELKIPTNQAPKGLHPCAADAYLMFQVILTELFVSYHDFLCQCNCYKTYCIARYVIFCSNNRKMTTRGARLVLGSGSTGER